MSDVLRQRSHNAEAYAQAGGAEVDMVHAFPYLPSAAELLGLLNARACAIQQGGGGDVRLAQLGALKHSVQHAVRDACRGGVNTAFLQHLRILFSQTTSRVLLEDQRQPVSFLNLPAKQALLSGIPRLCNFLGREVAESSLLIAVITFMNARRQQTNDAFFEQAPQTAAFMGAANTKRMIIQPFCEHLVDLREVRSVVNICAFDM